MQHFDHVEGTRFVLYLGGGLAAGLLAVPFKISEYRTTMVDWIQSIKANHSLSRAYWGQKAALKENARNRMNKYYRSDKQEVEKIKNFMGA
ncbi:MAG: hypothetical protein COB76_06460 [Alphaproteobacteria bacterium]|nr:MAG: hypothetical protein COB76_06460 [Alphaproteobacteria bacterium]